MNNSQKGLTSYRSGHLAEVVAKTYLRLKGYHCLEQNYRSHRGSGVGEVDLIFRCHRQLIFVEVKKRQNKNEVFFAVLPAQQKRILRAAESFIQQNPQYAGYDIRFDAVLIVFPFFIKHLQNAWSA